MCFQALRFRDALDFIRAYNSVESGGMNTLHDGNPADTQQHCPECDYNLTGAVEGRCPWCGWVIDEQVLSAMAVERSTALRIGAVIACLVCGGGALIALVSLVWHSSRLALRDGLAAVGVLVAVVGHLVLAGMLLAGGPRWPIYRRDGGALFRFAGWFSVALGILGATELLRSRDVQGVPVAATFEFALAAVFYTLPGAALLIMRMVTFRDPREAVTSSTPSRTADDDVHQQAPFTVEVVGRFDESRVATTWSQEVQPRDAAVEAAIEQSWWSARALAETQDYVLFDAPLVRLIHASVRNEMLQLELGETTYRAFVGTNMDPDFVSRRDQRAYLAHPLGISASVITRDGFVAYGRRGSRVAFQAGYVHPFGGMVDMEDRGPDGFVDLFAAMLRELQEETGLTRADVTEMVLIALVRDRRILQPELLFDVCVSRSRSELQARFDPERSDGEHCGIEFLYDDPEAALPSLARLDRITPIAEAAYLLHGRNFWGAEWFEQTCLVRYGEVPQSSAPSSPAV